MSPGDAVLENGAFFDVFTFQGAASQQVTIRLGSSEFDAFLLLLGPDGRVIAVDDDSGGGTNSLIEAILPQSGGYTIRASSFARGAAGQYQVSFEVRAGLPPVPVRPELVSISLIAQPSPAIGAVGGQIRILVIGTFRDRTTRDLTAEATFSSSDPSVANVNAGGAVTGLAAGTATIQATVGTVSDSIVIIVAGGARPPAGQVALEEFTIEPSAVALDDVGDSEQLAVTGRFSDGTSRDITREATYESSNSNVVFVNSSGRVRGVDSGRAVITVTADGFTDIVLVTVGAATPVPTQVSVSVAPSVVSIPVGGEVTLAAATSDRSDRSYTFASDDTAVATVSSQGIVTGVSEGTATLTATGDTSGASATAQITVTAPEEIPVGGTVRVRPQVIASGFNPILIDITDDSFDIIAIVRPSALPIRSVNVTQNQGAFRFTLNRSGTLPNGDQLWKSTFNFGRGEITDTIIRAIWGDRPGEFNITVIDQAQQTHSFPDLEFGNNPSLTQRTTSPNLVDRSPGVQRVRPQVLVAGFSPTLIDLPDDSFDIIAVVRQGAVPIRTVTITQNQGQFSISMNFDSVLDNGDQLYRTTFTFPRGSIANTVFRAVWGPRPGEFNVTAIDQAQQRHSYPDLEFGNNPALTQ